MDQTTMDTPAVAEPHHFCMHAAIRKGFKDMLGFDGCSTSHIALVPWILIGLLYISMVVRYRRFTLHVYYAKRSPPKFYSRLTSVPWEALIAALITIPRLFWATETTLDAISNHDAWKNADFSNWMCWGLVLYVGVFDFIERRLMKKRMLAPYWAQKQRDTEVVDVKTVLREGREEKETSVIDTKIASNADIEKAQLLPKEDQPAPERKTWRQRVRVWFTPRYPKATATNVLAQYHCLAFIKAVFGYVFLSEIALSTCLLDPQQMLNSEVSLAPAMIVIGLFSMWRFSRLLGEGLAFSKEIDWEALEQERAEGN